VSLPSTNPTTGGSANNTIRHYHLTQLQHERCLLPRHSGPPTTSHQWIPDTHCRSRLSFTVFCVQYCKHTSGAPTVAVNARACRRSMHPASHVPPCIPTAHVSRPEIERQDILARWYARDRISAEHLMRLAFRIMLLSDRDM
jgi:hypothetical protein